MLHGKVRTARVLSVSMGAAVVLSLSLFPPPATADGVTCEEFGGRRPTRAEAAFLQRVHGTLARRFPAAEAGWEREGPDALGPEEAAEECLDEEGHPLELRLRVGYRRVEGNEERHEEMQVRAERLLGAAHDLQAQEAQEARMAAFEARLQEAMGRGDMAAVQRIGEEMQQAFQPLRQQGERMERDLEAAEAEVFRDTEAWVMLRVNATTVLDPESWQELSIPGAAHAFEQAGGEEAPARQRHHVTRVTLLGSWRWIDDGGERRLEPVLPESGGTTRVENLWVEVDAVPTRAAALLGALDPPTLLEAARAAATPPR